jgi:voltage-gated sodium channel
MKLWSRDKTELNDEETKTPGLNCTPAEDTTTNAETRWQPLALFVDSEGFQTFIAVIIVLNAVVLGLETYSEVMFQVGNLLVTLNSLFYGVFLVELILRIMSYGKKPWNFFRSGWNVFDFVVIGGALLPIVRDHVTVLRLLRLARVVRLMRFMPDARILLSTITRATPAVISMVVLTGLVLFVYGILGWLMFGAALPAQWGDVGTAMLTLFVLLTLEEFPTYLAAAQGVSGWATIFFLSYVLIAAFIIVNLLIGIVISSMERAREEEAEQARQNGRDQRALLLEQISRIRMYLDEIEDEVDRSSR